MRDKPTRILCVSAEYLDSGKIVGCDPIEDHSSDHIPVRTAIPAPHGTLMQTRETIMRLKSTLPLDKASGILDEALQLGRESDMHPLTVVVLDAGGRIVAAKSEDGSGILRFNIAMGKAWGALGMGISSRLIRDRLKERPVFQTSLAAASDGKLIPVPGGVLIEDAEGFTIGAVGISGDTSEKDEFCAIGAIKSVGLSSEPAAIDPNWQASKLSDADK